MAVGDIVQNKKRAAIRLHEPLDLVDEKLRQQIAEGESLLEIGGINRPLDLAKLRSEITIWKEYTVEVLKLLFDDLNHVQDFDLAVSPDRAGSDIGYARTEERKAILEGITHLKSLRKRLPLIADKDSKPDAPTARSTRRTRRDARSQVTVGLLERISLELANSYKQVLRDVEDVTRVSYRGTANELREILREVLVRLAPDEEVSKQLWFGQEGNNRPTHRERARYILEKKGAGSRVHDVAEGSLGIVDEGLSQLVRDMYTRTSVATHTAQDLQEIRKLVGYFEPLIQDLCG
jgi:hypothetical protein